MYTATDCTDFQTISSICHDFFWITNLCFKLSFCSYHLHAIVKYNKHIFYSNIWIFSLPSKLLMNCLIWSHFQVICVALPNLKMALESTEVKIWVPHSQDRWWKWEVPYIRKTKLIQTRIKKFTQVKHSLNYDTTYCSSHDWEFKNSAFAW